MSFTSSSSQAQQPMWGEQELQYHTHGYQQQDQVGMREPKSPLPVLGGLFKSLSSEKKVKADGQPPKRRGPKPDSKPAMTRRQELNRQAQRTHRERKELYIKALEAELLRMKERFEASYRERDALANDNNKLRDMLHGYGVAPPPVHSSLISPSSSFGPLSLSLPLSQQPGTAMTVSSTLSQSEHRQSQSPVHMVPQDASQSSGSMSFCSDSFHGGGAHSDSQSRSPMLSTTTGPSPVSSHQGMSGSTSHHNRHQHQQRPQQQQQQQQRGGVGAVPHMAIGMNNLHAMVPGGQGLDYATLGVDFVTTLERPCMDHMQMLLVRSNTSTAADPQFSGHVLMATCPPFSHIETRPDEPYEPVVPDAVKRNLPGPAQRYMPFHTPHGGSGAAAKKAISPPPMAPPPSSTTTTALTKPTTTTAEHPPSDSAHLLALLDRSPSGAALEDGEVTPISAWAMIMRSDGVGLWRVEDFDGVKRDLAPRVRCYGFGAVLEDFEIRDAIRAVLDEKPEFASGEYRELAESITERPFASL